jgi:hypothetical protein
MPKAGGKWDTFEITAKGRTPQWQKVSDLNNGLSSEGLLTLQHAAGVIKFGKVAQTVVNSSWWKITERAFNLPLSLLQPLIQLITKRLSVALIKGGRAAHMFPTGTHGFHKVTHGEAGTDGIGGIKFSAGIEC